MRALLSVVFLLFCMPVFSADRYYGEVQLGVSGVRHSDLVFRPVDAHLTVGGYYAENLGVEFSLAGPIREGDDGGFSLEVESLATVALRFDSPPASGLSAYILLGVSQLTLTQRGTNSLGISTTVREDFTGATAAIGLRQQIANSRFSFVGAFRIHDVRQPIDIDGWTIGLRAAW